MSNNTNGFVKLADIPTNNMPYPIPIDVNGFYDYRSGEKKPGCDQKKVEMACLDYIKEVIRDLGNRFEPVSYNGVGLNISDYLATTWYGPETVIDDLDNAVDIACKDGGIRAYIKELRKWYEELLLKVNPHDEQAIEKILKRISEAKAAVKKYYSLICPECYKTECKEAIKKVIDINIFRVYTCGTFSAYSPSIELYPKSIAAVSGNSTECFNAQFWATVAHETFHLYHYLLCLEKNPDQNHWNNDRVRTLAGDNGLQDYYQNGGSLYDRLNHRNHDERVNDGSIIFRLKGIPSDNEIVKESLASYFEYWINSYGFNKPLAASPNIAIGLNESWHHHTVKEWPYSGARAFLGDGEYIDDPDALFKAVLYISLTDWEKACDIILKEYMKH